MKKPKKITKAYLKKLEKREVKRQFKEWALKVKERDGFECCICYKSTYLHSHHIFPRELKLFRFELDNGITLCPLHHKFSTVISPHKNPMIFFNWLIHWRTEQYNRLYRLWKEKGGL